LFGARGAYLLHNILDLHPELLLGAQQPLPDLVADHAALQECGERGFSCLDLDDARDVFAGALEQGGAEDRVWDFRRVGRVCRGEGEQRHVDVALDVSGEVGGEGERFCCEGGV
jgi:hypothetical protein